MYNFLCICNIYIHIFYMCKIYTHMFLHICTYTHTAHPWDNYSYINRIILYVLSKDLFCSLNSLGDRSFLCLLESRLWVSMSTTNKHTWLLSDVWDCCSSGLHGSCQQSSNTTTLISNIEQSISSYPHKTKNRHFLKLGFFFFNWDEAFPTPDVWSWIWSISQQQGLVNRNSEFKKKFTVKCFQLYQ